MVNFTEVIVDRKGITQSRKWDVSDSDSIYRIWLFMISYLHSPRVGHINRKFASPSRADSQEKVPPPINQYRKYITNNNSKKLPN